MAVLNSFLMKNILLLCFFFAFVLFLEKAHAQGLNCEIGIQHDFHQYSQGVCVVDDLTFLITREFTNGWEPKTKCYIIDTLGNILSEDFVLDIWTDETNLIDIIPSPNGGVYASFNSRLTCDIIMDSYIHLVELLPDGTIAWQNEWIVDGVLPYTSSFGLSLTSENELYFSFENDQDNTIFKMDAAGELIDSLNVPLNHFTWFETIEGELIAARENTLLTINETGEIDTLIIFDHPISASFLADEKIYLLIENDIHILSTDFNEMDLIIEVENFDLINLKLIDDQLTCSALNDQNNYAVLTINEHGEIEDIKEIPVSHANFTFSDFNAHLFSIGESFALSQFSAIRYRNYSLATNESVSVNHSDIGVVGLEISDKSATPLSGYNSVYNISLTGGVWVKNFGEEEVNSFFLFCYVTEQIACGYVIFKKEITDISIEPGDSALIDLGQFFTLTNNFGSTISWDVCVYSSFPNKQTDLNVSNDSYCENIIFGYSNTSEVKLSDVIVYPNPSSDFITISTEEYKELTFEIYDNLGKVVEKGQSESNEMISLKQLSNGVYTLRGLSISGTPLFEKRIVVRRE